MTSFNFNLKVDGKDDSDAHNHHYEDEDDEAPLELEVLHGVHSTLGEKFIVSQRENGDDPGAHAGVHLQMMKVNGGSSFP